MSHVIQVTTSEGLRYAYFSRHCGVTLVESIEHATQFATEEEAMRQILAQASDVQILPVDGRPVVKEGADEEWW